LQDLPVGVDRTVGTTQAERHVAQGDRILERQRGVSERIRRDLYDMRLLALAESLPHTYSWMRCDDHESCTAATRPVRPV